MLGAFDIRYLPWTVVKGQVLADLVTKFTEESDQFDSEEVRRLEKEVRLNIISSL